MRKIGETKPKLLSMKELNIEGNKFILLGPYKVERRLKVHRLSHHVHHIPTCDEGYIFGHGAGDCVRTYALAASGMTTTQVGDLLMDE